MEVEKLTLTHLTSTPRANYCSFYDRNRRVSCSAPLERDELPKKTIGPQDLQTIPLSQPSDQLLGVVFFFSLSFSSPAYPAQAVAFSKASPRRE